MGRAQTRDLIHITKPPTTGSDQSRPGPTSPDQSRPVPTSSDQSRPVPTSPDQTDGSEGRGAVFGLGMLKSLYSRPVPTSPDGRECLSLSFPQFPTRPKFRDQSGLVGNSDKTRLKHSQPKHGPAALWAAF